MPEDQLQSFIGAVRADSALQERLKAAMPDLDAVAAIAKDAGFDVNKEEMMKFNKQQTQELSDEELETAAGGNDLCSICWEFCTNGTGWKTNGDAIY